MQFSSKISPSMGFVISLITVLTVSDRLRLTDSVSLKFSLYYMKTRIEFPRNVKKIDFHLINWWFLGLLGFSLG